MDTASARSTVRPPSSGAVDSRIAEIQADFTATSANAAWLLCDRHPSEAVALRFVSEDLSVLDMTFGELATRSRRAAQALADLGVGQGDRVASLMGKGVDLPALILGVWRLGAVYVPLFTAFAGSTVADRIDSASVQVLVTDAGQLTKTNGLGCTVVVGNTESAPPAANPDFGALLRQGPEWTNESPVAGPDTPIVHMFTSGTTGRPKTVVHPLAYAAGWQSYLELGLAPGEAFWCGADPGWAYGLYTLFVAPLAAGVPSIVTCGTFRPEATWRLLATLEVTDFAAAPTVFRALRGCDDNVALPALQRLSSAGEPLTPEVGEWTRSRFGIDVHDHFGQTELGMPAGFAHHPDLRVAPVPRAMGTAFPGWSMTVLDPVEDRPAAAGVVGRLAVRVDESPFFTFTGYGVDRDVPGSRFAADGAFYLSGDLASIDEAGLIRFSARDDDVILMAGYRIGPFDIESVLLSHPRVAESAVVAAPDAVRGEVIHAFIVPTGVVDDRDALVLELQNWVRQNYGAHAYPRQVSFVDTLPKTPSGKVQRAVLRKELATPAAPPGAQA